MMLKIPVLFFSIFIFYIPPLKVSSSFPLHQSSFLLKSLSFNIKQGRLVSNVIKTVIVSDRDYLTVKQQTKHLNNHSYEWIMDYDYEILREISQLFVCFIFKFVFMILYIQLILDDAQHQTLFGFWKNVYSNIQ